MPQESIKEIIMIAYNLGWNDSFAGDDIRSIDNKTEKDIIDQVMEMASSKYREFIGP